MKRSVVGRRRIAGRVAGGALTAAVALTATVALSTTLAPAATGQLPEGILLPARTALAEGRVDEALDELRRLRGEYPGSPFVALWLGHAWRAKGDRPAAVREYLRGLDLDSGNAQLLIALGDLQADAGNLVGASSYYERAIEAAPRYPAGHRKAAAVEVQRLRHGAAIDHLQAYQELRPTDVEALNVLGIEQFLNEDHDAAIATLERVLEIAPEDAKAHFGIGLALSDRRPEHERALVHLRTAIATDPDNPTAHYLIGRILTARDELDAALAALRRSLELAPDLADAHYRIALVYARLGDRATAAEHQRRFQALTAEADDLEAREIRLGTLQAAAESALASSDVAGFRNAVAEMLDVSGEDPDVLAFAAAGALRAGDLQAGIDFARRARAAEPDHWQALTTEGMLLVRAGQPDEALVSLERAVAVNPLSGGVHAALGNALMEMDDADRAVEAYRAAVRLEPRLAAHYQNLAAAYRRLGMSELEAEAMARYRELLAEQ